MSEATAEDTEDTKVADKNKPANDKPHVPAFKKRVGYQGGLLGGFATLAATLLVFGNLGTHDTIDERLAEDLRASLSQVIPSTLHTNNLLDNQITIKQNDQAIIVYQGIKDKQATALAYSVSGFGYAGEIKLIMGIKANGEILGVRVISHSETPGLGDKIEAEKDDWIYSFDGLSLENMSEDQWKVKKDGGHFDQFSGATITPRAVVKAIHQGLTLFQQNKTAMLAVSLPAPEDKIEAANNDMASKQESEQANNQTSGKSSQQANKQIDEAASKADPDNHVSKPKETKETPKEISE